MNDLLSFDPVLPLWISLLLILVAVGTIIWKEYRDRRKGLPTIFGIALITLGLAGIVLRPSSLITRNSIVILLTPNYETGVVDSLLRKYPEAEVYTAPQVMADGKRKTIPLTSWHELSDIPSVDVVVGEGMPPYAWDLIEVPRSVFLPANLDPGLLKWIIPKSIKANSVHELRGEYYADEPTILKIEGAGVIADSTPVEKGLARFSLAFKPKNAGPLTLTFTEKTKGLNIAHRLGLTVEKADQLKVLFLQDYPTFEGSYLKNFLAQRHSMAIRYRLSRKIFRYEYVNMPTLTQRDITKESLGGFDVVILTPSALQNLARAEKQAIESAVRGGLGILITGGGKETVEFGPDLNMERSARDTVHVSLAAGQKKILKTGGYLIRNQPRLNPVLSQSEKILTGYVNYGFGRIGYTVLTETYPLLLRGDSLAYANLWIPILESIATQKRPSMEIRAISQMPFLKDEPFHLEVFTHAGAPELYYDSVRIPVIEDPLIANRWNATIWPTYKGWNLISAKGDSTVFWFFVNNPDEWQSLRSQRNADAAKMYAVSTIGERRIPEWQRINPIIFYALFLSGMSILWIIPKMA